MSEENLKFAHLKRLDARPYGWEDRYSEPPTGVALWTPGGQEVLLLCDTNPHMRALVVEAGVIIEDITPILASLVAYGLSKMGVAVGGDGAYIDGTGRYEAGRLTLDPLNGDDQFYLIDLQTETTTKLNTMQVMRAAAAAYGTLLDAAAQRSATEAEAATHEETNAADEEE